MLSVEAPAKTGQALVYELVLSGTPSQLEEGVWVSSIVLVLGFRSAWAEWAIKKLFNGETIVIEGSEREISDMRRQLLARDIEEHHLAVRKKEGEGVC